MEKRIKKRCAREVSALTARLHRIEGQVRGIARMIEEDGYCVDVLNQTAAVRAALLSFEKVLLRSHIEDCVTADIKAGKEGAAEELTTLLGRLIGG
ncbi:MAG: metal-sensing transcriptional repressor [Clostridia bacterium]|nr:metal-sensing transcriptional repressor [Clostridia bacterium]